MFVDFSYRESLAAYFSLASKANEDGQDSNNGGSSSPGVGSVVVTLEARNKLVLGVFLRTGAIDNAWEYWEGNFGPSELVAHVREPSFLSSMIVSVRLMMTCGTLGSRDLTILPILICMHGLLRIRLIV